METFKPIEATPTSTPEWRQRQVDETNAELRLLGVEPDADTRELQRRYVAGEITAQDLIDWVVAFLRMADEVEGKSTSTPKDLH